jgi:hypothetical protein
VDITPQRLKRLAKRITLADDASPVGIQASVGNLERVMLPSQLGKHGSVGTNSSIVLRNGDTVKLAGANRNVQIGTVVKGVIISTQVVTPVGEGFKGHG